MDHGVTRSRPGGVGNGGVHQNHPADFDDAQEQNDGQEGNQTELDQRLAAGTAAVRLVFCAHHCSIRMLTWRWMVVGGKVA